MVFSSCSTESRIHGKWHSEMDIQAIWAFMALLEEDANYEPLDAESLKEGQKLIDDKLMRGIADYVFYEDGTCTMLINFLPDVKKVEANYCLEVSADYYIEDKKIKFANIVPKTFLFDGRDQLNRISRSPRRHRELQEKLGTYFSGAYIQSIGFSSLELKTKDIVLKFNKQ